MWKKILLSLISLTLLLAANLNVCWKVKVSGKDVYGLYSTSQFRACEKAAVSAADEICRDEAQIPMFKKSLRLSFLPPAGKEKLLTDRMILSVPGICLSDEIFVDGERLGTVPDSNVLYNELRSYIKNQMPNRAVFGSISGEVTVRHVYSCVDRETGYSDMVLLISGAAPVFYVDKDGQYA